MLVSVFRVNLSLTALSMSLTASRLIALRVTSTPLVARMAMTGVSGVADLQVW